MEPSGISVGAMTIDRFVTSMRFEALRCATALKNCSRKRKKKKNEKKKMEKHSVKIRFQKILGLGENFVNIENDESGVAQNPVDELKLGKTR